MGILSRDHRSLEQFEVLPGNSGPVVPSPVTSLLPHLAYNEEDYVDDEPTGVLGTLKEMPVGEIVQTLAQGMKDALIEVKPKGEPVGVLFIEHGRVVYCACETPDGVQLEGELAFQRLFCAHRGAFRIRYGRGPESRNIDKDLTWLLLEAARVLDESRSANPVFDTPPAGTPSLNPIHAATQGHPHPQMHPQMHPAFDDPPPTPPPLVSAPRPVRAPERQALPRTVTPFSRFFDEAGVKTPPPVTLPPEAQRFQSLQLVEQLDDVDDIDRLDTDRTTPQRRTGPHALTPT